MPLPDTIRDQSNQGNIDKFRPSFILTSLYNLSFLYLSLIMFSTRARLVPYSMVTTGVSVVLTVCCMKIPSPGGKTRLSR